MGSMSDIRWTHGGPTYQIPPKTAHGRIRCSYMCWNFACSGECVCTLHYHEYDKPSPDFSEALNIQCRHKKTDSYKIHFTELISPHHRNSQNSAQQALELMHLRQVRLKSITPDIAAKIMRPWNLLSATPDSGQMRPHFASAIYRDCCAFLDLGLVIMCNRKSIEAQLTAFEVCLPIVVGHSTAYIHTLLLSSTYYLIVSETVQTYLRWNCLPTSTVYYRSHNGYPRFHRCSLFRLH